MSSLKVVALRSFVVVVIAAMMLSLSVAGCGGSGAGGGEGLTELTPEQESIKSKYLETHKPQGTLSKKKTGSKR